MKRKHSDDAGEPIETSTPLNSANGSRPVPKRLEFTASSDSEEEVFINTQAYKKRKMSDDDEMKIWIRKQFEEQHKKLATREQVENITRLSEQNKSSIEAQRKEIEGIHGSLRTLEMDSNDMRRSFDARVRRIIADNDQGARPRAPAAGKLPRPRSEAKELAYKKARRSIRIWPMEGDNADEIMTSVKKFCCSALFIGEELGIETVERLRSPPRGVAFKEVLVTFVDNWARDKVFACGPRLSGYRDSGGKPTCGLHLVYIYQRT